MLRRLLLLLALLAAPAHAADPPLGYDLLAEAEATGAALPEAFDSLSAKIAADDAALGPYGGRRPVTIRIPGRNGEHRTYRPLDITRPNLTIRGDGPGASIIHNLNGTPCVRVQRAGGPVPDATRVPFANLGLPGERWAIRTGTAAAPRWVAVQGSPIDRGSRHWRDTRQFTLEVRLSEVEAGKPLPDGPICGMSGYNDWNATSGGPWVLWVHNGHLRFDFHTTDGDPPTYPDDVKYRSRQRTLIWPSHGDEHRDIVVQIDMATARVVLAVDGERRAPLKAEQLFASHNVGAYGSTGDFGTGAQSFAAADRLQFVPNYLLPLMLGASGPETGGGVQHAARTFTGIRVLQSCPYADEPEIAAGSPLRRKDGRPIDPERYFDPASDDCLGLIAFADPSGRFVGVRHGIASGSTGWTHGVIWGDPGSPGAIESVRVEGLTLRNATGWGTTLELSSTRDARIVRCAIELGFWGVGGIGIRHDWSGQVIDTGFVSCTDAGFATTGAIWALRDIAFNDVGYAAIRSDASMITASGVSVTPSGHGRTEVDFRLHMEGAYGGGGAWRDILVDREGGDANYAVFHVDCGRAMSNPIRMECVTLGILHGTQAGVLLTARPQQWEQEGRDMRRPDYRPGTLTFTDAATMFAPGAEATAALVRADSDLWSIVVDQIAGPAPVEITDRAMGVWDAKGWRRGKPLRNRGEVLPLRWGNQLRDNKRRLLIGVPSD
jgi:hypothetical protein